jgi:uncharacterized protein YjbI with pentapeptide repeats
MERSQRASYRVAIIALLAALVTTWAGVNLVEAATGAPGSITTCTKAKNGKTKVIASSLVTKCTAKGKGFAKQWTDANEVRYHNILRGSAFCGTGPTNDFTGLDLSGHFVIACLERGDFTGDNMSGAVLAFGNFANATLNGVNMSNANALQTNFLGASTSGANVSGVNWNQTICPDGSTSDTNSTSPESCVGHGFS